MSLLIAMLLAGGPCPYYATGVPCRSGTDFSGVVYSGLPLAPAAPGGFTLQTEYLFGSSAGNPATMPTFAGDSHLKALCRIKSDGTTAECIKADDGALVSGSKTGGTGAVFRPSSPWIWPTQVDVTDAQAFKWTGVTETGGLFAGDLTVVFFGYGTEQTGTSMMTVEPFDDGCPVSGGCGLWGRYEGGNLSCLFFENAVTFPTAVVAAPIKAFSFGACIRSGANHYAFANGQRGPAVNAANVMVAGTNSTIQIGRNVSTANQPLRGQWIFVAIFDHAKTDAQLLKMMANIESVPYPGLSAGVGQKQQCFDPDGGAIDCIIAINYISEHGLLSVRPETARNLWAADNLDACSWDDVGTPGCTQNVKAGQFRYWLNTNEMDALVDNDGAAFEGKQSPGNFWIRDGQQTIACSLAAGTSGTVTTKARLRLITDGALTGTGICDITGLTSTPTIYTCTDTVTGASSVKGQVLEGNVVADTGSVIVGWCKGVSAGYVSPATQPINATVNAVTLVLDPVATPDGGTWPSTAIRGKYSTVFTPVSNTNSQWTSTSDAVTVFDMAGAGGVAHMVSLTFGAGSAGTVVVHIDDGAGNTTEGTLAGVTLNPGQRYGASVEWRTTGVGVCTVTARWDTCATVATCNPTTARITMTGSVCPGNPVTGNIGHNADLSLPSDLWIDAVRISGP